MACVCHQNSFYVSNDVCFKFFDQAVFVNTMFEIFNIAFSCGLKLERWSVKPSF